MAESMVGLKRSHRCTEVSSADIGKKVTVMGCCLLYTSDAADD